MATLTYVKGLPTPIEEMTVLGFTEFELFLNAFSPIYKSAVCETIDKLKSAVTFNKSQFNSHLQSKYGLNKRQCNGIITIAKSKLDSATECRVRHLKQLEGKLKSAKQWVEKQLKKIKNASKFYSKKNWESSKSGCVFPLSCDRKTRRTNWQFVRFNVHHKKRYIYKLSKRIQYIKSSPIHVKVTADIFIVGSKDETLGNQTCQWDGNILKFRVPYCLEDRFGKYVETEIGNFDRNINRLPTDGAKTWHFYRKDNRWVAAIQFTPSPVTKISRPLQYGAIGIDLNPTSIGWAYVDYQGNLKASGKIPLQPDLPSGKQQAQLVDICLQIAVLAQSFACPVICEELDFTNKKEQLREKSKRYARMLSGWTYSEFFKQLNSILSNRGIRLVFRNPAFTSLIGLTKYSRLYGVSSDIAAAIAIARRGMNLSERLPHSVQAYLDVFAQRAVGKSRKHIWSGWKQFNNLIRQNIGIIKSRHSYFGVSNWGLLVKVAVELQDRAVSKQTR
jgi:IS605 OrfB family transposase